MDNSVAKVTLEKSWVHNHFIKSTISKKNIIGEQRKLSKCRTKSGKKIYIALCIVVKYIHVKQVIYLYININIYAVNKFKNLNKCILNVLHSNEAAPYNRWDEQESLLIIIQYNMRGSNKERYKALMRILCAEWCAWSNTESLRSRSAPESAERSSEHKGKRYEWVVY